MLTLPAPTYTPPQGPAPEKKENLSCFAPKEGIFAQIQLPPPELRGQVKSYSNELAKRIFSEWNHNMPRGAKDVWARGRIVAVRFAILPDGSSSNPTVTVSSGKGLYDMLAQRAVESQLPFPPLPAGMKGPICFCMEFGYNLDTSEMDPARYDEWEKKTPAKP